MYEKLKPQKYYINGFRFNRYYKKKLKELHDQKDLSAAAAGVFTMLLNETLPTGTLPFDYKHSKIAKKYNVKYSTYTSAIYELIKLNLVAYKEVGSKKLYSIVKYSELNLAANERSNKSNEGFSYYRIPGSIFTKTDVIQTLIKRKDVTGILFVTSLFDTYTMKFDKEQLKAQAHQYKYELTNTYLKGLFKRSAKKICEMLDIVSPLFSYETEGKIKEIRKTENRIRKAVKQVCVNKFSIVINNDWVDSFTNKVSATAQSLIKNVAHHLQNINMPLTKQQSKDIQRVLKSELVDWKKYVKAPELFNRMCRAAVQDSLTELETAIETLSISNVGGFLRKKIQEKRDRFVKFDMESGDRIDLADAYFREHGTYPKVFMA